MLRKIQKFLRFFWHIPRNLLCLLIRVYQKTLSPDHGPFKKLYPHGYCRFSPTCSDYGHDAIKKYGVIYGGLKAFWRILRCNPCSKGGVDLP